MKRRFGIGHVVAVGFAFTVACTVCMWGCRVADGKGLVTAGSVAHVCAVLIFGLGIAITDRWLPNPLVYPVAAWSLVLAVDTLVYSVLFGLFYWLFRAIASRRQSRKIAN